MSETDLNSIPFLQSFSSFFKHLISFMKGPQGTP